MALSALSIAALTALGVAASVVLVLSVALLSLTIPFCVQRTVRNAGNLVPGMRVITRFPPSPLSPPLAWRLWFRHRCQWRY